MKKRILALLLAAIMVVSILPIGMISVFAAPTAPEGFVNITFLSEDESKIMIQENQQTVFSELAAKYRNKTGTSDPIKFIFDGKEVDQNKTLNELMLVNGSVVNVILLHNFDITNGTPESDSAKNHGYIAIDKTSASEDETVTVEVHPADGYQLKSLTVVPAVLTFKAVYDTTGGANTLTFYYDAVDHSGEGITVYDNLPAAATQATDWDYNANRSNIKIVEIDSSVANYHGLTSTSFMFQGMKNANSISGAEYLDVSNVTDMSYMFNECSVLESLDVSNFDMSKVNDMSNMFSACKKLQKLSLYGNESFAVTDMSNMFASCESLTELEFTDFDTSNVTNMANMFQNCKKLQSLDLNGFDTKKVTDMGHMFENCECLHSLYISTFDTSNVTKMNDMFSGCSILTDLDLSEFTIGDNADVTDMFSDCLCLARVGIKNKYDDIEHQLETILNEDWVYIENASAYIAPGTITVGEILPADFPTYESEKNTWWKDNAEEYKVMFKMEYDSLRVGETDDNVGKDIASNYVLKKDGNSYKGGYEGYKWIFYTEDGTLKSVVLEGPGRMAGIYAPASNPLKSPPPKSLTGPSPKSLTGPSPKSLTGPSPKSLKGPSPDPEITPAKQADGTYTFTMPAANVTVTAVFEEAPAHIHTFTGDYVEYETGKWAKKCSGCGEYDTANTLTGVIAPAGAENLVYNGLKKTGVEAGTGYTLSGTYEAVNAGTYKATATLADGYIWSDGTTTAKEIVWSIAERADYSKLESVFDSLRDIIENENDYNKLGNVWTEFLAKYKAAGLIDGELAKSDANQQIIDNAAKELKEALDALRLAKAKESAKEWFSNPFNSLCLGYYSSELVEDAIAGLDTLTSAEEIEQYKADYISILLKAREDAFKISPYSAIKKEIEDVCKALGFDNDKTAEILSDFDEFISSEYNNETRDEIIGAIAEKYGMAQDDAAKQKAVRELYFSTLLMVNSNWMGESSQNPDDMNETLIRSLILFDDNDKIAEAIDSGNLEMILMALLECYPDYAAGYSKVAGFEDDTAFDTVYAALRNATKTDKAKIELKAAKTEAIEAVTQAFQQNECEEAKAIAEQAIKDIEAAETVSKVEEIKSTAISEIQSVISSVCPHCGQVHKNIIYTLVCYLMRAIRWFFSTIKKFIMSF